MSLSLCCILLLLGLLQGWVLTESTEEVAEHEGSQAVEEENLTHEPEIHIWHLEIAVVGLRLEVSHLRPYKNNSIVEKQGEQDVRDAEPLLKSAQGH